MSMRPICLSTIIQILIKSMQFDLTHNGAILTLKNATQREIELMEEKSKAKAFSFHTRKYYEVSYLRLKSMLMSGLWKRMLSISQITKIPVQINGLIDSDDNIGIIDPHITRDVLEEWLDTHTFKFNPYWYQFECLYYALKYRLSRCEVATAGGKSFTIFLYCRYLLETGRVKPGDKILVITIRRMLVTQMKSDIEEYQSTDTPLLKCDTVFSGGRKFADSNVVIGTYQTLSGYDKEYFDSFGAIIVDECHQAHITSIKDDIIPKLDLKKCKYRFGLSGTQPLENTVEGLHLEAYIGPILFRISAAELQDEGTIAQIQVNMIKMIYPLEDCRKLYFSPEMASEKVYEYLPFERHYVQYHQRRCIIIKQIVERFVGNQIILVENVDYAKYLVSLFSEIPEKQVHLIYSATPDKKRNEIKASFEKSDNIVLVATYETMSTGVSIKNIHALHFPDGGKSRVRMRQSCGRGLRLHPSKEYLTVFDYVDVFKKPTASQCEKLGISPWPGPAINRLYNQGRARKKIYQEEKFPIHEVECKI